MENPKELYTAEIKDFTEKYSCLGKLTVRELPDIDTMDYIFSFEKLNGTSEDELDEILLEIYDHMEEFCQINGIERFCQNTAVWL